MVLQNILLVGRQQNFNNRGCDVTQVNCASVARAVDASGRANVANYLVE